MNKADPWYVNSQAKALAELFLDKLKADFSDSYSGGWGDYHLKFRAPGWPKLKSLYIELKATRKGLIEKVWSVKRPSPNLTAPYLALLLVADVINEKLYYGWVSGVASQAIAAPHGEWQVPIRPVKADTAILIREAVIAN